MLVVVLVLENPDRFAIRLTEQISSIGLFAVTESQCTEDEHDDEDEDDFQISEFGVSGDTWPIHCDVVYLLGPLLKPSPFLLRRSRRRTSTLPRTFRASPKRGMAF